MNKQDCHQLAGAGLLKAQNAALDLFQLAALITGDEEQAVSLVEETLAKVEADPCADTGTAQDEARPRLVEASLRRLAKLHPQAFSAPPPVEGLDTCIDIDDLAAAGLSSQELGELVRDPGRSKMREWLEHLAPAFRAVFVLRAVVGQDGETTAESLRRSEAQGAQGWGKEQVGAAYRQALCSLASALLSAQPASAEV